MSTEITLDHSQTGPWEGRKLALGVTYGKMMMWFFLLSDAFTFSAFLTGYGYFRFISTTWPNPEVVFQSVPVVASHGLPLVFVGIMTFILIASSLTMVLAVEAGHRHDNNAVKKFMVYTVIGGLMFLSCQAYEWNHLIHQGLKLGLTAGDFEYQTELAEAQHHAHHGAAAEETHGDAQHAEANHELSEEAKGWIAERRIFYPVVLTDAEGNEHEIWNANVEGDKGFELPVVSEPILDKHGVAYMDRAGNYVNPEGYEVALPSGETTQFGNLFFFITGFHGFHVFTGVLILIIIMINVFKGTYVKRGHYEMVEKVGLYWHFVDLVWVFVFTLFYLI